MAQAKVRAPGPILPKSQGPSVLDNPIERLIRGLLTKPSAPDPSDVLAPMMASPLKPAAGTMADVARDAVERFMQAVGLGTRTSKAEGSSIRTMLRGALEPAAIDRPTFPVPAEGAGIPRTAGQFVGQVTGSDKEIGLDELDTLIQDLADEFVYFKEKSGGLPRLPAPGGGISRPIRDAAPAPRPSIDDEELDDIERLARETLGRGKAPTPRAPGGLPPVTPSDLSRGGRTAASSGYMDESIRDWAKTQPPGAIQRVITDILGGWKATGGTPTLEDMIDIIVKTRGIGGINHY